MSVYQAGARSRDSGIPTKDYGISEYLYRRLRDVDRDMDAAQGQTVAEVMRVRPTIDDSQVPDEIRGEYQLQRFLRIFGAAFNHARTKIDATLSITDPERCESKWLLYLGKLIGWDTNTELDTEVQRAELLSAVEMYKRKGRGDVLDFLIDAATDFDYRIVEMKSRVLTTWAPDEVAPNLGSHLFDPDEAPLLGTENDPNFYLIGDSVLTGLDYSPLSVTLYIVQNLLALDYTLLTGKLERIAVEFAPFGVTVHPFVTSIYAEPSYDAATNVVEDEVVHEEIPLEDLTYALYTWASPASLGNQNPGTLADPADSSSLFPLWDYWLKTETWTHTLL